jgi:hypothetical protein
MEMIKISPTRDGKNNKEISNQIYATLALFLDQPGLEKHISRLRGKLNFPEDKLVLLEGFTDYYEQLPYIKSLDELDEENYLCQFVGTEAPKNELSELAETELKYRLNPKYLFEKQIKEITNQFKNGIYLEIILQKAIICGEVNEQDYKGQPITGRYTSIIRDRKVHWINKRLTDSSGRKGFQNLAKETINKYGRVSNKKTIEKAVKAYDKRLTDYLLENAYNKFIQL